MSTNSEYIEPIANDSPATSSPDDEIDSLPDSAPSDDIDNDDEEEEESDAEKEWKESLQQLELILTMVLVPYAGKYFGRKCAYWGESEHCDEGARMRLCPVVGELTIKRVGEIYGVEVPGRGSLHEQEDVPSDRSCRSRCFSMIAEGSSGTLMARELRVPATSLHVEENARVSAMGPGEEVVTKPSETYLSQRP